MYAGHPLAALDWSPEAVAKALAYRSAQMDPDLRERLIAPVGLGTFVRAAQETLHALVRLARGRA